MISYSHDHKNLFCQLTNIVYKSVFFIQTLKNIQWETRVTLLTLAGHSAVAICPPTKNLPYTFKNRASRSSFLFFLVQYSLTLKVKIKGNSWCLLTVNIPQNYNNCTVYQDLLLIPSMSVFMLTSVQCGFSICTWMIVWGSIKLQESGNWMIKTWK